MGQDAKLEHRLAAIMATDVVGYSQSMQADEAATLAALGAIREAIESLIKHHRGRIANTAGDGVRECRGGRELRNGSAEILRRPRMLDDIRTFRVTSSSRRSPINGST